MSDKIVNLVKPEPNQTLIEAIERLLVQVKEGKVIGMVGVKLAPEGKFSVLRAGDCSDLELAGALSFAQHDLIVSNNTEYPSP